MLSRCVAVVVGVVANSAYGAGVVVQRVGHPLVGVLGGGASVHVCHVVLPQAAAGVRCRW